MARHIAGIKNGHNQKMVVPVSVDGKERTYSVAFEIDDGLTDRGVVDDFGLGNRASNHGSDTDLVNAARDALRPLGDALESIVGEQGDGVTAASNLEMMLDVGQGDIERERIEVATMGNALGEGSVRGELEHAAQFGLTNEDESRKRLAVKLGGKQSAQWIDEQVRQQVGFINDDDRCFALGLNEIGQDGSQGSALCSRAEGDGLVEQHEELAIQGAGGSNRQGQVEDDMAVLIERSDEGAHGGGLAATDIAGDESDATFAHGK